LPELNAQLKKFIGSHLTSIEDLEVLLSVFRQPEREWDAVEVSRELSVDPISIAHCLLDLTARGLFSHRKGAGKLSGYRFSPSSPGIELLVRELEIAYRASRLQVIDYVVSPFRDDLLKFADAFKLKKDGNDG
jgi:hypothetical protein